jgi:hypothetical protein
MLGSIAAGTVGYATLTQDAEAASVAVEGFDIPDKSITTPTPVSGVSMDVNGSYSWTTSTTPTDVTLRLSVTYATETQQLGAMRVPGELQPQDSGDFTLDVNLLDHGRISAPALTPTEVGETKELTFDTSLTMIVDGDSGELGRQTVEETATITVEREQAGVTTTLSAHGTIDVTTKTPV